MLKRKTTEQFIKEAIAVHGDKYDYSLVAYIRTGSKVKIVCREHGEFLQVPSSHLNGCGCPLCKYKAHSERMDKKRLSTEDFIKKAKSVHCERYDYRKASYKATDVKLVVTCNEHGDFLVSPHNHLRGKGCPRCAKTMKLCTEAFVEKARLKYGDKYQYTKVDYKKSAQKVVLTCPIHGDWECSPANHLRGKECPSCKGGVAYTQEIFVEKAMIKHQGNYAYDKAVYVNSKASVIITCPKHGDFLQAPASHLDGAGCPLCKETGFNAKHPSYLYLIECTSLAGTFTGYGITKSIKTRMMEHRHNLLQEGFCITKCRTWGAFSGENVLLLERLIKQVFNKKADLSHRIDGFKRESSPEDFNVLENFIVKTIEEKCLDY